MARWQRTQLSFGPTHRQKQGRAVAVAARLSQVERRQPKFGRIKPPCRTVMAGSTPAIRSVASSACRASAASRQPPVWASKGRSATGIVRDRGPHSRSAETRPSPRGPRLPPASRSVRGQCSRSRREFRPPEAGRDRPANRQDALALPNRREIEPDGMPSQHALSSSRADFKGTRKTAILRQQVQSVVEHSAQLATVNLTERVGDE